MSRHESVEALRVSFRQQARTASLLTGAYVEQVDAMEREFDAALRRFALVAVEEGAHQAELDLAADKDEMDLDAIVDRLLGPRDDAKETR